MLRKWQAAVLYKLASLINLKEQVLKQCRGKLLCAWKILHWLGWRSEFLSCGPVCKLAGVLFGRFGARFCAWSVSGGTSLRLFTGLGFSRDIGLSTVVFDVGAGDRGA